MALSLEAQAIMQQVIVEMLQPLCAELERHMEELPDLGWRLLQPPPGSPPPASWEDFIIRVDQQEGV